MTALILILAFGVLIVIVANNFNKKKRIRSDYHLDTNQKAEVETVKKQLYTA